MRISDANRNDQVQMQQAHISFRDILFCTPPPHDGFTHTSVATGDIGKVQLGSVLPLKGVGFLFSSLPFLKEDSQVCDLHLSFVAAVAMMNLMLHQLLINSPAAAALLPELVLMLQ